MSEPVVVGLLYPGYAAEDDYRLLDDLLGDGVSSRVVHTEVPEDAHRVDALLELGDARHLAAGAERLRGAPVDSVVWACTSGSFVFGWAGAREQAEALGKVLGVPASSTSFAFVDAARRVGVTKVGVAATYPEDVTARFVDFLREGGIDVVHRSAGGIVTAAEVAALGRPAVLDLVARGDHRAAEAVLVPDTALPTVAWLEEMEDRLGKPVLTANQVSAWAGLRLAGARGCGGAGAGTLFRDW